MIYIFRLLKWGVILGLIFGLAFLIYGLVKINQPFSTQGEEKVFEVSSGMSTKQVAAKLENEGLINDSFFFELYIYFAGTAEKVQAGKYVLSSRMSIAKIARHLTAGEVVYDLARVTVIEGWGIPQIADALDEAGVVEAKSFYDVAGKAGANASRDFSEDYMFLKSKPADATLEGFLFPDTYYFERGDAPEDVVKKMLDNFDRQIDDSIRSEILKSGKDFYSIITIASLIEREVGRNVKKGTRLTDEDKNKLQQERRLVASVFYNRLDQGMRLESDATVGYVTGSNSSRATLQELKVDSPYNTYLYQGLPPTPISNPSIDSVMAAIHPTDTDYLYFLTAPDGTAYFAETFVGHQQNRAKYLE